MIGWRVPVLNHIGDLLGYRLQATWFLEMSMSQSMDFVTHYFSQNVNKRIKTVKLTGHIIVVLIYYFCSLVDKNSRFGMTYF